MFVPCDIMLTNTNYFSWKAHIEEILRSRGLYWINLGKETKPIDENKEIKWENKCDEVGGLIGILISTEL